MNDKQFMTSWLSSWIDTQREKGENPPSMFYDILTHLRHSPEANAIESIREHNAGCAEACKAQRPNERQSGGCGWQRADGSMIYSKRCPNCPMDWKVSFPLPQNGEAK